MRICDSQFGFKTHVGTAEALVVARHLLGLAWADKDGQLLMVRLDWQGRRSIASTLQPCKHHLRDLACLETGGDDRSHLDWPPFHCFGRGTRVVRKSSIGWICQGCPLPPFLFSIVMTVLMQRRETNVA